MAEQAAGHLKAEETSLREELKSQMLLLSEFEKRFEQKVAESTYDREALRLQVAQSQTRNGKAPATASERRLNELSIDDRLADAEKIVKVLGAEKIQLLEAYELLESDTGRLIDDAVAWYRDQLTTSSAQTKARI